MKRKDGFYWVKLKATGFWEPALWRGGRWHLAGFDTDFDDGVVEVFGERCVRVESDYGRSA